MTLNELKQIKSQLDQFRDTPLSLTTVREVTKSIWVVQREIELKTLDPRKSYGKAESADELNSPEDIARDWKLRGY